jgi:hypothetical protein
LIDYFRLYAVDVLAKLKGPTRQLAHGAGEGGWRYL